ncbi:MAG: hypothetical protein HC915_21480 [Anaerolineae bacterium]|nr:hypothetical protein [Anaerolineae bacterium]
MTNQESSTEAHPPLHNPPPLPSRPLLSAIVLLLLGLLGWGWPVAALADDGSGQINFLTASGENPVTISVQLEATSDEIEDSNLRFFIYDINNNVVHTHGPVDVPELEADDDPDERFFDYNWNWEIPELGQHRVVACWSYSGGSCSVAQSSTIFESVATLGDGIFLGVAAVALLAWLMLATRRLRQG